MGPKRFICFVATGKERREKKEESKEIVAVFGKEKGRKELHLMGQGAHIKGLGDTTIKDLKNWLR